VQLVRVEKTLTRTNSNLQISTCETTGTEKFARHARTHYAPKLGNNKVPKWELTFSYKVAAQSKSN
jgi:hypothetical protein